GDDAVPERPDRDDVPGRAPEHRLGLVAHRQDRVVRLVDGDDGRLVEHDALAAYVHERVRGPKIDCEIVGEQSGEQVVKHQHSITVEWLVPERLTLAQSMPWAIETSVFLGL